MEFTNLLGKQLKDDEVIEILEHYDIDVIYNFDRTHEGMEDIYWAASKENGFQFRFNESQKLDVIFLYMVSREGFTPISRGEVGVPIYESFIKLLGVRSCGVRHFRFCSLRPTIQLLAPNPHWGASRTKLGGQGFKTRSV